MSHHDRTLSLATVTLLLLLTSPVLPFASIPSSQVAQAQTVEDRRTEALRLNEEGLQLNNKGQFREALETFQAALLIVREIGERQGEAVILNNIGLVYRKLVIALGKEQLLTILEEFTRVWENTNRR